MTTFLLNAKFDLVFHKCHHCALFWRHRLLCGVFCGHSQGIVFYYWVYFQAKSLEIPFFILSEEDPPAPPNPELFYLVPRVGPYYNDKVPLLPGWPAAATISLHSSIIQFSNEWATLRVVALRHLNLSRPQLINSHAHLHVKKAEHVKQKNCNNGTFVK